MSAPEVAEVAGSGQDGKQTDAIDSAAPMNGPSERRLSKALSDTDRPLTPPRVRPQDLPPLEIPQNNEPWPWLSGENECAIDDTDAGGGNSAIDQASLLEEFERRWILNISMNFRDGSQREKFFVTFAEKPNLWRRVTISLDYRRAPPGSLEADLRDMKFQRDKSLRIYEAIRASLPEIQYFPTVTNLKLVTTADDNQLHVHVREDGNEIVAFPAVSLFRHISCPRYCEAALAFDAHLSGFVYKVRLPHGDNRVLIKKEIPGPDTVDEFLYEVNALEALRGSEHVIRLEGLVTDDHGEVVKGLLISYADRGTLADLLYDLRYPPPVFGMPAAAAPLPVAMSAALPWPHRARWARQIVAGLADIHEAGFVQGDFTLSNIVIDSRGQLQHGAGTADARVIDINRRGCPVGWEPPEFVELIAAGQRVSMAIGVKSDLYQLGMVLWALAMGCDEPEREMRPLPRLKVEEAGQQDGAVPGWYREIVEICLSERPQGRLAAEKLLERFPKEEVEQAGSGREAEAAVAAAAGTSDEVGGGSVEQPALARVSTSTSQRTSKTAVASLFGDGELVPSAHEGDSADYSPRHRPGDSRPHSPSDHLPRAEKVYIDPTLAVTLDDCRDRSRSRRRHRNHGAAGRQSSHRHFPSDQVQYLHAATTREGGGTATSPAPAESYYSSHHQHDYMYDLDDVRGRGRGRRPSSPDPHTPLSSATSFSSLSSPRFSEPISPVMPPAAAALGRSQSRSPRAASPMGLSANDEQQAGYRRSVRRRGSPHPGVGTTITTTSADATETPATVDATSTTEAKRRSLLRRKGLGLGSPGLVASLQRQAENYPPYPATQPPHHAPPTSVPTSAFEPSPDDNSPLQRELRNLLHTDSGFDESMIDAVEEGVDESVTHHDNDTNTDADDGFLDLEKLRLIEDLTGNRARTGSPLADAAAAAARAMVRGKRGDRPRSWAPPPPPLQPSTVVAAATTAPGTENGITTRDGVICGGEGRR